MKRLIALFFIVGFCFSTQAQDKELFHRAKFFYNSSDDLKTLSQAGVDLDHGFHKKDFSFESDFSQSEINIIKQLGFKTEIVIEDVGAFYVNQNNPNHKSYVPPTQTRNASCSATDTEYQTPSNYDIKPGNQFGGFYTYSEMLAELDAMAAQYPNLITARADNKNPSNPTTHQTSEGRYQQWVKISDNPNANESEPQVLYTAIHHAREPASLQQLIFFMWYLLENYATDDEIKAIVDNTELYFIPCVNPDGYIYNETTNPQGGGNWRKNRHNGHGVDNNRNYSYITNSGQEVWNTSGTSNNTGSDVYAGTGPWSEPENRAIRYFVETHDFKLAMNNHTFGNLLLFPYGYANNVPTPDNAAFEAISELLVSDNGFNNMISSGLYPAAGDSDDFMYGMLTTEAGGTRNKVFAMTPEIGNSFWPAASSIESICKSMMFSNIHTAKVAINYVEAKDNADTFFSSLTNQANFSLKHFGLEQLSNLTVSINPVSANISSVGAPLSFTNLSFLQEINDGIQINLSNSIEVGDIVTYEILVDNGLFTAKETVSKYYGQPSTLLEENGNNANTNWTTSGWSATTEDFAPGSASSSITDSPNSNYSNNQSKTITVSNAIDLSAALVANLTFYAKWDIEANYDYVQVEVSTDNGDNWIPQCGKFTNTGVPDQNAANGEPLYDGTQNSWVQETISLSDYIGNSILIRFQLVTDGGVTEDGFYFDDLQVEILQNNLNTTHFETVKFDIFPNPVKSKLFINTTQNNYSIKLYNVQGQLVFSSENNNNNSSIDYSKYANGLYLLQIANNKVSKSFKIIKK